MNVWSVHIPTKQVSQVTNYPIDIDNLKLAPNKQFIAFSAEVYVNCFNTEAEKTVMDCTAARDAEFGHRSPNTWRQFTKLMVYHWDRFEVEGRLSHIFYQPIVPSGQTQYTTKGNPVDIMQGMNVRSPVYPDGGPEQIDISPESNEIAYTGEVINERSAWFDFDMIFF